jgi:thiopeptide-type bacteriocin biosynthesis protein
MTDAAALAEPGARRRRRRGAPGLYDPVGWILVRAPLLPTETYLALGSGDELAPHDPLVRTALAVGSRDLLPQLERAGSSPSKKTHRLRASLLRYLIRMSTRPTPYGLFAGVGLAELGQATDLRIAAAPPRTRTRPDMEWLLRLVAQLEARPEVRRELRVFANPAVLQYGARAFLAERAPLGATGDPAPVGIRATGAVRRALALARTPVSWQRLTEELLETPGATPEKVEGLLTELWEQTFLLTDLRPPLTHPSPARHVAAGLAGVASAAHECAALQEVLDATTAWDELPMAERPGAYRSLSALATAAVPEFDGTPMQVDTALALEGGRLHEAVAREAANAAELLLRLSPSAGGLGQLDAYRHAFIGRYGTDREVPLVELLDPDHGLGPPSGHGWSGAGLDQAKLALRDQTLRGLALDALRERRLAVALDRATLGRLALSSPSAESAPVSLDIAVFVLAGSAAAIDAGDFELLIGPNLGAQEAGRNLGRFGDLLGAAGSAALAAVAAAGALQHPGGVPAELVYLPRRGRSANVAIRPAIHRYEIAVGTMPGVASQDAVALSEVLIGVRDGRFYARWPAVEGDLRVYIGHMLNAHQAPAACRFLEDVARDGRMQLGSFDWGPATELPFVPRIQSGRIVLAPAQWQIDRAARDTSLAPSEPDFAAAVARWREAWLVPRYVYLTAADNRLLLDLEAPDQVEQLRQELAELPDGRVVVLQEPLPGPEHAWLAGPDGSHLTELVVPIALRAPAALDGDGGGRAQAATAPRRRLMPRAGDRLRPPGSDWLFVKLYCPRSVEEELLTGPIRSFCQLVVGSGLADRWFFMRYSDPDPHLRMRFGGAPDRLVADLLPKVCAWSSDLIAEGSCRRVSFDTYEREIERYGGLAAIEAAETLFAADSAAVVELLRIARHELLTIDRTALAVLSVDALLDGLGLDAVQRLEWYRGEVNARHLSSDDYRERQRALRGLLGEPAGYLGEPGGPALARILTARRAALGPVAERLGELGEGDQLDSTLEQLCQSYVHLHCNRLLGAGPPTEQHVLGLLLRTREGLERAPVAHREQAR